MVIRRRLLRVISIVVIQSMIFAGFSNKSVSAQGQDGLGRQINSQTGKVSFIEPESRTVLPASKALGISPATHFKILAWHSLSASVPNLD